MSKVYPAIAAVMADVAYEGIGKNRRNTQQGYQFRGIDDVYNTLSSILAKHGLLMLPRILSRSCEERTTRNGSALFYVTVEAEFDLVAAEDGSKHTIRTYGEAMDSADKATNKAMSAAYKYAAMQAFCIPTEGDNDADSTTHDVTPAVQEAPPEWMARMEDSIRRAGSQAKLDEIRNYIATKPLPEAQLARLAKLSDEVESQFVTENA
ncbi:MAG: single-stranded DNA-binding protein [Moraxellaceae bacterium]|nr:single-stranded DNA-binding protein [Moraxellaceae bacterium]